MRTCQAGLLVDLAEGRLLAASRPALRRPLGQGPGPTVALAPAAADDEPRLARTRGGRRSRRRRWRSRSSAAPRRRRGARAPGDAGAPGPGPLHDDERAGTTARACARTAAGWIARQPARSCVERRDRRAVQDGRPRRRGLERAGRTETQPALPDAGRGTDESRRRAGRVLGRDAVIHGRLWYRFGPGLQGRREHCSASSSRPPVPGAPRDSARSISRRAAATRRARGPPGRARAGSSRCACSVPTSPRVIGPVSAARIPSARALPERPLDERAVDRQRAGLVEPGDAAELGDRVEQRHEPAGRQDRRGVVGRLRARAPGGPARRRSASAMSASSAGKLVVAFDRDGRPVERRRRRAPCRRRRPAGGTRRSACRRPSPARGPRHRGRRSCGSSPGRCTSGASRPAGRSRRRGRRG